MTRGPSIFALVLAVACGCGKTSSSPPAPSPAPTTTTPPASSEKAAPMTEPNPAGAWRSSIAPDAPMHVTATASGVTVAWTFTTDSDNEIAGALARQADHSWRGTVHLKAGEEASDVAMTLRLDPTTHALRMELAAMFSDPISFERVTDTARPAAPKPAAKDCAPEAMTVLSATTAYKKLEAANKHLRTMQDGDTGSDRKCDLRVFVDSDGGETQTVARFRVDFAARQVLQYNPAEDNYTPLANTAGLFATGTTPAPPPAAR
jgi:hypothetical protein